MSNSKEVLESFDVRVSSKGNVCLNDIVKNIIKSTNPDGYMKTVKDKFEYKNKYYVTEDTCMDILNKGRSKTCKKVFEKIKVDDSESSEDSDNSSDDNKSIVSVDDNIFQYAGNKFTSFFVKLDNDDWDVWLKAVEVATYLEYENTTRAIRNFVSDEYKLSYKELRVVLKQNNIALPNKIDKKTIFINLSGFLNLIHGSMQPLAQQIKQWLDGEIIPSLVKKGSYYIQPKILHIKSFYDTDAISSFYMKSVLYIGYVGWIKVKFGYEHIFKYGLSRNSFKRLHKDHIKTFGKFDVVYIGECHNCDHVETLFENDMVVRKLHRSLTFNGTKQTELFTISQSYSYIDAINHMKELIVKHALPAIKEAANQIVQLEKVVDTFHKSDELKKLELEFKMSDNFKLEVERDIKIKEKDVERDIKIKEKDVEMKEIEVRRLDAEARLIMMQLQLEHVRNNKSKDYVVDNNILEKYLIPVQNNTNNISKKKNKCDVVRI